MSQFYSHLSMDSEQWDGLKPARLSTTSQCLKLAGGLLSSLLSSLLLTNCQQSTLTPRTLAVAQHWELTPGNFVAGYRISGGLGDISIEVRGRSLYAPFTGTLQPHEDSCAIFSSPEVPAYLLRFCDIKKPQFGDLQQGNRIGVSQTLQFATLRKQPTGEWTIVEPAQEILEQILTAPSS